MDQIERMARSALGVLTATAAGHGMIGVRTERRSMLTECLLEATGCTIEVVGGRRRAIRDGVELNDRDTRRHEKGVASTMAAWLATHTEVREAAPLWMTRGSDLVIDRMGVSATRVLLLLEVMHYVAYRDGGSVLEASRTYRTCTVTYRRGPMRWRDGIVSMRHRLLPSSLSTSMTGKRIGDIIDDPIVADRPIRRMCDVSPREGMLRIVTMDAGLSILEQGKRTWKTR